MKSLAIWLIVLSALLLGELNAETVSDTTEIDKVWVNARYWDHSIPAGFNVEKARLTVNVTRNLADADYYFGVYVDDKSPTPGFTTKVGHTEWGNWLPRYSATNVSFHFTAEQLTLFKHRTTLFLALLRETGGDTVSPLLKINSATLTLEGTFAVPTADFTADRINGPIPLGVDFKDQSTGNITSWQWDFGDGSSSNERDPSHTYTESGIYTTSLTVTGPGGSDTEVKTDFIEALEQQVVSERAMPAILSFLLSNEAPTISAASQTFIAPGQPFDIPISVSDSEGDQVTWEIQGVPAFAQVVDTAPGEKALRGTTDASDIGEYEVTIVAIDDSSKAQSRKTISLLVGILFIEDWEDGVADSSNWSLYTGTFNTLEPRLTLDNVSPAEGAYSFCFTAAKWDTRDHVARLYHTFPNLQPSKISVWIKSGSAKGSDAYFVVRGDDTLTPPEVIAMIYFRAESSGGGLYIPPRCGGNPGAFALRSGHLVPGGNAQHRLDGQDL